MSAQENVAEILMTTPGSAAAREAMELGVHRIAILELALQRQIETTIKYARSAGETEAGVNKSVAEGRAALGLNGSVALPDAKGARS